MAGLAQVDLDLINSFYQDQAPVSLYDLLSSRIPKALKPYVEPAYTKTGAAAWLDKAGELIAGIYYGMPNDTYHSLKAVSSSEIKKFVQSPAHYEAAYIRPKTKKNESRNSSFDVGTISHELILEGQKAFDERRFVLLDPADYENDLHDGKALKAEIERLNIRPKTGSNIELAERLANHPESATVFELRQLKHIHKHIGPEAVRELEQLDIRDCATTLKLVLRGEAHTNTGVKIELSSTPERLPVYPEDYQEACKLTASVQRNKTACRLFANGLDEVTFIAKDPITGMMVKCRTDWLSVVTVFIPVDLKTARSANPTLASYQFADLRYDLQAAFYHYVIKLSGLPVPERQFPFVTAETGDQIICEVFNLHDDDWDLAESELPKLLKGLQDCLNKKLWGGYTKSGVSTLRLPRRRSGFFLYD